MRLEVVEVAGYLYKIIGVVVLLTFIPGVSAISTSNWADLDFDSRKTITITNNNNSWSMPTGYEINLSIDTTQTGFDPSGNNIKIYFYNGTNYNQIEMYNLSPFNQANTDIFFHLNESLAASTVTDNYAIYFDNNTEITGLMRNKSCVFNYTEDFEGYNTDDIFADVSPWVKVAGDNYTRFRITNSTQAAEGEHALNISSDGAADIKIGFTTAMNNTNIGVKLIMMMAHAGNGYDDILVSMDRTGVAPIQFRVGGCGPSEGVMCYKNTTGFVTIGPRKQNAWYKFEYELVDKEVSDKANFNISVSNETAGIKIYSRIHQLASHGGGVERPYMINFTYSGSTQPGESFVDDIYLMHHISPGPGIELSSTEALNVLQLCSDQATQTSLNFTTYDEEKNGTILNITYEVEFDIVQTVGGVYNNLTFNVTDQHFALCIYPEDSNYTIRGTIKYYNKSTSTTDYNTRYYFMQNYTIDNTSDDISLYLLEDQLSNDMEFSIMDNYNFPVEDVVLKATRFFVSEDQYKQVDMGLTDYDGNTVLHLKLNEWYIFLIERNGVVIRALPQKYLISTSSLSLFTGEGKDVEFFDYYNTLAYGCENSESAQMITCTYSDTSGKMASMKLTIEKRQLVGGFITICENTSQSTSGTISCSYAGYNNTEIMYELKGGFCCSDPTSWSLVREFIYAGTVTTFGITGIIVIIFAVIVGITLGLWNPIIPIATSVFVIIIGGITGLIAISSTGTMALLIAGVFLIYKMRS